MDADDRLRLDYEQSGLQFRMLADIRARLLAIVPTIAGIAVAAMTGATASVATASVATGVGIVGGVATFGIILYELRNTQLYDAAMQRLRSLEAALKFRRTRTGTGRGGVHLERPGRNYRFLGVIRIIHDHALGLVYGSAIGAWAFLTANGVVGQNLIRRFVFLPGDIGLSIPLATAIVLGGLTFGGFHLHDRAIADLRQVNSEEPLRPES